MCCCVPQEAPLGASVSFWQDAVTQCFVCFFFDRMGEAMAESLSTNATDCLCQMSCHHHLDNLTVQARCHAMLWQGRFGQVDNESLLCCQKSPGGCQSNCQQVRRGNQVQAWVKKMLQDISRMARRVAELRDFHLDDSKEVRSEAEQREGKEVVIEAMMTRAIVNHLNAPFAPVANNPAPQANNPAPQVHPLPL
jgi:hypothetical protein